MERDLTFDVLKGIGILLVFVAHTFVKGEKDLESPSLPRLEARYPTMTGEQ